EFSTFMQEAFRTVDRSVGGVVDAVVTRKGNRALDHGRRDVHSNNVAEMRREWNHQAPDATAQLKSDSKPHGISPEQWQDLPFDGLFATPPEPGWVGRLQCRQDVLIGIRLRKLLPTFAGSARGVPVTGAHGLAFTGKRMALCRRANCVSRAHGWLMNAKQ